MSGLRAIDLQMAMPRSQMAGKIQDQMNQRGQVSQDILAAAQQDQDQKNATSVTGLDQTVHNRAENNDANPSQPSPEQLTSGSEESANDVPQVTVHPYKGNLFDESR
ncbi:hypothetical protein [Salisediminibacterium selenitireducens]|uniref:Uncharacterized protein n=1 Tax=Bacillus selenitireducens (strain ATCC 700615 / DSM 15326 / MLS10) TaxID=439292 RepID=D6XTZ3_BACIE|nr:hypothetical protein [Salisediminibacterium selenitireducens]ADH99279.1 hypothetical protein Bsel_1772 [[Bacillus] selenitireducens MLS10]